MCIVVDRNVHYLTFSFFQDIVPLITIRCREDLRQFPVIGGSLNTYIGLHDNPSILNNGSILIWRGENVKVEEPTESKGGDEYSTEGEGSDYDSGDV